MGSSLVLPQIWLRVSLFDDVFREPRYPILLRKRSRLHMLLKIWINLDRVLNDGNDISNSHFLASSYASLRVLSCGLHHFLPFGGMGAIQVRKCLARKPVQLLSV